MKNSIRIVGALLLTAIYCGAIAIVTTSFTSVDSQNATNPKQEKYSATVSNNLLYHNIQSESSINSLVNLSDPSLKDTFNIFVGITVQASKLSKATFAQYSNFSRNLLIRYRKTDLIFPAHYFW